MEIALLTFALLFTMIVLGGLLVPRARRKQEPILEPPLEEGDTLLQPREPKQVEPEVEVEPAPEPVAAPPRFRDRLGKTRGLLGGYGEALRGRSSLSEAAWEDLEEALIRADVGVRTTTDLLEELRAQVKAE